jgi:hypothetical protein
MVVSPMMIIREPMIKNIFRVWSLEVIKADIGAVSTPPMTSPKAIRQFIASGTVIKIKVLTTVMAKLVKVETPIT